MTIPIGSKVRFTGKYLRNTGQMAGGEGRKVLTVVACGCGLCKRDFVAVDEKTMFADADMPPNRHINTGNLRLVGSPVADHSADDHGIWVKGRMPGVVS